MPTPNVDSVRYTGCGKLEFLLNPPEVSDPIGNHYSGCSSSEDVN